MGEDADQLVGCVARVVAREILAEVRHGVEHSFELATKGRQFMFGHGWGGSEDMMYGSASSDEGAMEFDVATDGGTVAGITSKTVAGMDGDGNAVVVQAVEAGYLPVEVEDEDSDES